MKFTKYLTLLFIVLVAISSCALDEIETYNGKNLLYFEDESWENSEVIIVDTVEISSTLFPGQKTYTHYFLIHRIGMPKAAEFRVEIDDTLSEGDDISSYISVPEISTFKDGQESDSLAVTFNIEAIKAGERGSITYRLVKTDFFDIYDEEFSTVKIWFNNIPTKPLWWDNRISQVFLGEYSVKKLSEFILFTGVADFTSLPDDNKRYRLCREFKKHIAENGITEEDGSPMIIPAN